VFFSCQHGGDRGPLWCTIESTLSAASSALGSGVTSSPGSEPVTMTPVHPRPRPVGTAERSVSPRLRAPHGYVPQPGAVRLQLARVGKRTSGTHPRDTRWGAKRWCSATPAMSLPERPEPVVVLLDHDAPTPADGTAIASRPGGTRLWRSITWTLTALRLPSLDHHGLAGTHARW